MRSLSIKLLVPCGLLVLFGACKQKPAETASSVTPTSDAVAAAPTSPPAPAASAQTAPASPVTADPVVASQRNASRRARPAPAQAAAVRGSTERNTGYSEERRGASRRDHEVPSGTILRVAFDKTISTATARTGDTVSGELLDDLLADDGTVVASSGSRVTARIENAVASGRLGGQAQLSFRLTELTPPGGRPIPLTTSLYQRTGEAHTKHDAEYIAGGAAVGALLGQLLGRDSESTLKGAAAGAAAGTGVAAATGALDFEVQAGRTVAFTLEQPLRMPAR